MKRTPRKFTTTDLVAVILAGSMGLAVNLFIIAAVVEAYSNPITLPIGLSDNATQVLTGWGGGIIGVIGALVGIRVGSSVKPAVVPEIEQEPEVDTTSRPVGTTA